MASANEVANGRLQRSMNVLAMLLPQKALFLPSKLTRCSAERAVATVPRFSRPKPADQAVLKTVVLLCVAYLMVI